MFDIKAQRPVLFWSGGADSTLVLALLCESSINFDIVTFNREWFVREQKQYVDALIKKCSLKVFSYPPAAVNLIGDGENLGAVFEYAIGNGVIPVVTDLEPGTRCIADLGGMRMPTVPMDWDLVIVGTRKDDAHWSVKPVLQQEWIQGNTRFYAPLFDWNRSDVLAELKTRGIEPGPDTGSLQMCTKCLEGETFCPLENKVIPQVKWDRHANLKKFRDSLGVSQ